jgi:hypothetical protein
MYMIFWLVVIQLLAVCFGRVIVTLVTAAVRASCLYAVFEACSWTTPLLAARKQRAGPMIEEASASQSFDAPSAHTTVVVESWAEDVQEAGTDHEAVAGSTSLSGRSDPSRALSTDTFSGSFSLFESRRRSYDSSYPLESSPAALAQARGSLPSLRVISATEMSIRLSTEIERDYAFLSDAWSAAVSESFLFGAEAAGKHSHPNTHCIG